MNPLPPVHVQTGPLAGDSSLSTQNEDEENRSVNSANHSHYSQSDNYVPNPEDYFATMKTTNTTISASSQLEQQYLQGLQLEQHDQEQYLQGLSNPTPRHSNRTRALSNSEVASNTRRSTNAMVSDLIDGDIINNNNNNNNNNTPNVNVLIIRITTRPMSWSPQVVHADGSSHTLSIDLPQEFARNSGTRVITQQGWQDLYHIIVTVVAKNTSESVLLFWISGFVLIIMALVLLFGLARGMSARFGILLGTVGVASFCGILHTVVRRFRVHSAVRKCCEECFYDPEAEASKAAANTVSAMTMDVEQPQQQHQNNTNENFAANEPLDRDMGAALDGLQELEDVANADGAIADGGDSNSSGGGGGGFGRALRQRLNSHSSAHSNSNSNTTNRQRLNTGGNESTTSSNMIFDEEGPRSNRAISRDGMYCVNWRWEYLGMDAVVKITWE